MTSCSARRVRNRSREIAYSWKENTITPDVSLVLVNFHRNFIKSSSKFLQKFPRRFWPSIECKKELNGTFFVIGDNIYACNTCTTNVSPLIYNDHVTHSVQKKCNDEALPCSYCKKNIIDGGAIRHDGHLYHAACFTCHKCTHALPAGGFFKRGDLRLCEPCSA